MFSSSIQGAAQRAEKLSKSWIVADLLFASWKPDDLPEGIRKRVEVRLRHEPNKLFEMAGMLIDRYGNQRLQNALAPYRKHALQAVDLDSVARVSPETIGPLIYTATQQLTLLTTDQLAAFADQFLRDEQELAVEEVPPMQFSLQDTEGQLPRVLVELGKLGMAFPGDTDRTNFVPRLLAAAMTRNAMLEIERKKQSSKPKAPPKAKPNQAKSLRHDDTECHPVEQFSVR